MSKCVLIMGLFAANAQGAEWTGVWKGSLTNSPPAPNAKPVEVTMEIGAWPAADHACAMWRSTYREESVVKQVKDYRLCRGIGDVMVGAATRTITLNATYSNNRAKSASGSASEQ